MNELEIMVLNRLQEGIPLQRRPFSIIADELGIKEDDVISSMDSLRKKGYIRRFGAIVDINEMGVKSILVGMKVSEEDFEEAGRIISEYPGVTHNYRRDHGYNIWFTLMEADVQKLESRLEEIRTRVKPLKHVYLKSKKKYKTKVVFDFSK